MYIIYAVYSNQTKLAKAKKFNESIAHFNGCMEIMEQENLKLEVEEKDLLSELHFQLGKCYRYSSTSSNNIFLIGKSWYRGKQLTALGSRFGDKASNDVLGAL